MGTSRERTGGSSAAGGNNLRPVTREERARFRNATGRSLPRGAMTNDRLQAGTPARQSAPTAAGRRVRTGAVSREEFERATGRTPSGRKVRRRS